MDLYDVRKKLSMGFSLSCLPLRVTDYSRVSTDHLEQKNSLKNQVDYFFKMIDDNPNWTYVPGYVDEGISGTTDFKRDNFMRMIEDAHSGKFDLIVTKEISRFSRNTLDSIKYTRELLSCGVAVFFLNDNINTALPDSELRLTIMASMAQDEIRRLSERVKFGMNRAIMNGKVLGNGSIFGYKKDKLTGNFIIVKNEAKVVRSIYHMYAIERKSLSTITKLLNAKRNNKKWYSSTISRIIKNPKYKGYYCAKKSEVIDYMTKKVKYLKEDEWIVYRDKQKIPPIVSETLWKRANDILKLNKRVQRRKEKYLYSSKIYCYKHQTAFNCKKFRRNNKDITWICSEYLKNGKDSCDVPNIRESELNYIFRDIVSKIFDSSNFFKILFNYYKEIVKVDNGFVNLIKNKSSSDATTNKIIQLILERIEVSKNNDGKIILEVYLVSHNSILFNQNSYLFKRGYDTTSTKRYTVNYQVLLYI